MVETNARFTAAGIFPVGGEPLHSEVNALVQATIFRQEAIYAAATKRDLHQMYNCFAAEPLTAALTLPESAALFRTMVENTKQYLGGWK